MKNLWTRVGRDGTRLDIAVLREREAFETRSGKGHEIGNTGHVLIGVRHFGMANIGRKRRDRVVYVASICLPSLQTPANESVPQVMNAHMWIGAARPDFGCAAQSLKDAMDTMDSSLVQVQPA